MLRFELKDSSSNNNIITVDCERQEIKAVSKLVLAVCKLADIYDRLDAREKAAKAVNTENKEKVNEEDRKISSGGNAQTE